MHATPENNIKQALPPLPRLPDQPINWPTTSSGQDLQEGDEAADHKQLSETCCKM